MNILRTLTVKSGGGIEDIPRFKRRGPAHRQLRNAIFFATPHPIRLAYTPRKQRKNIAYPTLPRLFTCSTLGQGREHQYTVPE